MGRILTVEERNGQRRQVAIRDGDCLIVGRDAGCDIVIADDAVSSRHCELACSAGTVTVRDLGSTNGTVMGRKRVVESEQWGDSRVLKVGGARLLLDGNKARISVLANPGWRFAVAGLLAAFLLMGGYYALFHKQVPRRIFAGGGGGGSLSTIASRQAQEAPVDVESFIPSEGNSIVLRAPALAHRQQGVLQQRTVHISGSFHR